MAVPPTVIDIASRRVIGYSMADHLRTSLVTGALANAIAARDPDPGLIIHSDRGCQGGFNWSSQHLDHGGGPRFRALPTGQLAGQYIASRQQASTDYLTRIAGCKYRNLAEPGPERQNGRV
jgi:transposase InsO family protein